MPQQDYLDMILISNSLPPALLSLKVGGSQRDEKEDEKADEKEECRVINKIDQSIT